MGRENLASNRITNAATGTYEFRTLHLAYFIEHCVFFMKCNALIFSLVVWSGVWSVIGEPEYSVTIMVVTIVNEQVHSTDIQCLNILEQR